jgi:hypothetical protein
VPASNLIGITLAGLLVVACLAQRPRHRIRPAGNPREVVAEAMKFREDFGLRADES